MPWNVIWKGKTIDKIPSSALETLFFLLREVQTLKGLLHYSKPFLWLHTHPKNQFLHLRQLKPT